MIWKAGFRFASILICLAVLVVSATPAEAAKKKPPKVSHDGLQLQKDTKVAFVYLEPDADFSQYRRIAILDCTVAFRKNWQRDYNRDVIGLEGRISDQDILEIKKRVADEFVKVFVNELETKGGYSIVKVAAEDVLVLRPAIVELDITAPDTMTPGTRSVARSAGRMTLYLEFFDSVSGDIIARVIDPVSAPDAGAFVSYRSANTAEGNRIMSRWAVILRDHLDSVHAQPGAGE
jgi:hypothetical protein